jgi:cell division ATPase FtsA
MIVDIGGGTTEVAIMSLADIATCESVRVAGDDMDEAIINHMKRTYNMMIGEQTAERIKIEIGSASRPAPNDDGSPRPRHDLRPAPQDRHHQRGDPRSAPGARQAIIEAITRTLERAEPELAADLVENGITMAGGGSLLRGLTAGRPEGHRPADQARRRPAHLRRPRHLHLPRAHRGVEGHARERSTPSPPPRGSSSWDASSRSPPARARSSPSPARPPAPSAPA